MSHLKQTEPALSFPRKREPRLGNYDVIQVVPFRVMLLHQLQLPCPPPALDLLLPSDSFFRALMNLEIDEPLDAILPGKALDHILFVLPNSLHQVGCHPCIQGAITLTRKDVDIDWLPIHIPLDSRFRGNDGPEMIRDSHIAIHGTAQIHHRDRDPDIAERSLTRLRIPVSYSSTEPLFLPDRERSGPFSASSP